MRYMLDTNICIYLIKKHSPAILSQLHAKMEEGIAISAITLAELEYGVSFSMQQEKNADALAQFLAFINILPFDESAAAEYGAIRAQLRKKGTLIGPLDMLIGAHAKAQGLVLVSNNLREFVRIDGLQVENWVE